MAKSFEEGVKSVAQGIAASFVAGIVLYVLNVYNVEESVHLVPPWRNYYLMLKYVVLSVIHIIIFAAGVISNIEDLERVLGVDFFYSLGLCIMGYIMGDDIAYMIGGVGIAIVAMYVLLDIYADGFPGI